MVENKKVKVVTVDYSRGTIQGGLEIMAKGLKDWHDSVNPPPTKQAKPSRREGLVFPPPSCY